MLLALLWEKYVAIKNSFLELTYFNIHMSTYTVNGGRIKK